MSQFPVPVEKTQVEDSHAYPNLSKEPGVFTNSTPASCHLTYIGEDSTVMVRCPELQLVALWAEKDGIRRTGVSHGYLEYDNIDDLSGTCELFGILDATSLYIAFGRNGNIFARYIGTPILPHIPAPSGPSVVWKTLSTSEHV